MRGAGCHDAGRGGSVTVESNCGNVLLQLEIAELQRQEIDIRQEKEDKEREVADALAPRLASLELAGISKPKPVFFS